MTGGGEELLYIYQPGDLVVQMTERDNLPEDDRDFYPAVGTIGEVKSFDAEPGINTLVQWPKGTTFLDDLWWVNSDFLAPVADDPIDSSGLEDLF